MPRHPRAAGTTESLRTYVFSTMRQRILEHPGPLYRLHIGDTWLEPLEAARAEAQRTAEHPGLHRYPPVHGLPELLDAAQAKVKRRTGVDVPRTDLQVTAGATGGISVVCQALLDPGDEVLIPAPFWPLIRGVVASRGAVPVQVPFYDRLADPTFDVEAALERAITPRTTALYLNVPNNPTGAVLSPDATDAIARVAARHQLWVLSDEVYEDLWYGDAPPRPIWTQDALFERSVVIHSMSKAYGLAGARVGYVHGPSEAMRSIRAVQTFQAYAASRPMQLGSARALDQGDAWLAQTRAAYRRAAARASAALGLPAPAGGTFLFFDASPWLDDGDADAVPFLHRCMDRGVVLTPGASSGDAYLRWARICFTSVGPEELDAALAILHDLMA